MSALYDRAVARWGLDPAAWPSWACTACAQRNTGWALACGRCGMQRRVPQEGKP